MTIERKAEMNAPSKGTVWCHARRKDWQGEPVTLTVTSITGGKVYSKDKYGNRVKTPLDLYERMCAEVVSVPDVQASDNGPKLSRQECSALFTRAHTAGLNAGDAIVPTPMVVVQRENPFDDSSPVVRQYAPVMGGVCGFASVVVRPGNSAFARYLKAEHGSHKSYYGGVEYWVYLFGQSYERKRAYAEAFTEVLSVAGVKAYANSSLD